MYTLSELAESAPTKQRPQFRRRIKIDIWCDILIEIFG